MRTLKILRRFRQQVQARQDMECIWSLLLKEKGTSFFAFGIITDLKLFNLKGFLIFATGHIQVSFYLVGKQPALKAGIENMC